MSRPSGRFKPVSKDVKRFLDADKDDTRLLGSVRQHLLKKPVGEGRRQDVIHPSEMAKSSWCHRATAHRLLGHHNLKPFKPSYQLINVFEEGHLIHGKWQKWLHEMGILHGMWRCMRCQHYWEALSPQFCASLSCQSTLITYAEVPIVDEPRGIRGHADGIIKDAKGEALIEIKSIGLGTIRFEAPELLASAEGAGGQASLDQVWANLKRPLASHVRQANIYAVTAGIEAIVFLYEFKPTQAVKEFYVRTNRNHVSDLLLAAERITDSVARGELVDCPFGGCGDCRAYEG